MSDIITLPNISIAFVLVAILANVVAYFKVKVNDSQTEFLRKDRDDLIKRLEIRDGQLDEQTVLMAKQNDLLKKQQFEIESLKEKINVLTSLATGQGHIEALLQEIKNHNVIVENRYHEYMGCLTTMIESQQRIEQKVINSK